MFPLSFLTKLWWPFLHCCPSCNFALRRVQLSPWCVKCSLHLEGNLWYKQIGVLSTPPHQNVFLFDVISPSLVVSLLPGFPLQLDSCFTFTPMGVHYGDDKGHFCLLFGWRCVFDLQISSQVQNLPWEPTYTQTCCFPLLVLPSLTLVQHNCMWTNPFITSLTFLWDVLGWNPQKAGIF